MRYAACRIQKDRVIVCGYDKTYDRTAARRFVVLSFDEAAAELMTYEHLDVVVPAADMLHLTGKYPPVRRRDLEKIIRQDIETVTPFKGDEVVFDIGSSLPGDEIPVYIAQIERIKTIIGRLGAPLASRVRALIPETAIVSRQGDEQVLFLDDDTVTLADARGQIVRTGGIGRLVTHMRESLGHGRDEEEVLQILASSRNLSDEPALSEDELLLRKAAERFFRSLLAGFAPYLRRGVPTTLVVADRLPGNAEEVFTTLFPNATTLSADACLDRVGEIAESGKGPDLARGPFTYRGGVVFLRRRLISIAALFLVGFILMITAFEVQIWRLNRALDEIEANGRQVTKEILGKESPSLRQALATIRKTIEGKGGDTKGEKKLYPYSALFAMENIFPAVAFEGSSIEVREFSFKDGKVRLSGEADSIDHINTMIENLENIVYVSELNKGQITSRGGKSSFGIGFLFQKKSAKEQSRRETKKETEAPSQEAVEKRVPALETPKYTSPVAHPHGDLPPDKVPWEEEP